MILVGITGIACIALLQSHNLASGNGWNDAKQL
jgi:hypothetical protein